MKHAKFTNVIESTEIQYRTLQMHPPHRNLSRATFNVWETIKLNITLAQHHATANIKELETNDKNHTQERHNKQQHQGKNVGGN